MKDILEGIESLNQETMNGMTFISKEMFTYLLIKNGKLKIQGKKILG